ncbi:MULTISPECIES: dihydroneopterin aldolase [Chlamydia]|uniref:dihydroneopterin aldolase n=1 Tax=Chlamydia TaxID=810 RepID=UPI0004916527|nr:MULTISPECIES: dihydroneopterin aldolase [Chlamydia]MDS0919580.1 dihydroneopterin aldolase [Chlamydia psittaci]MDS0989611.1 dihydroneopterin aldolase [Chlamydia psittaci]MDS0995586.1 dihydroneopterin aldolase [Chlamydia psittaci]MDS1001270.1 dihydroneopterin aldolase [Chlamydia psittaci]UWF55600.1 dihydroneopterin aldolase [Chlamydia psittaci]
MIPDFRVWVRLGCSPEERYFKQPILVSVVLSFFKEPSVCVSDDLGDACCYVEITSLIEEVASSKPCALVEHLSKILMDALEAKLKDKVSKIDLEVRKERPPVPNLLKPICFKISREISL